MSSSTAVPRRPVKRPAGTVRLSVNLDPKVAEALRTLAEKRGATVSEVVRDAIATEKFLSDVRENDERLLLQNADGTYTREIILFR
jgi:hypothetical protein